jgi:aminoglycoside phosphotransferase family enzyme/predicted kinase
MSGSSPAPDDQADVLAFLEGGGLGGPVERIDTHGADVFLVGDRAFKMKRAVRFSFLDLSTRARREAVIRDELRLNLRTAPELYLGLLPVTRDAGGGLALGGSGAPVEWLLEMRRFPADAQLDEVAAREGLADALVDALAREIARLHERAEPRREMGGHAAMRAVLDGNAADLRSLVPDVLPADTVEAVTRATAAALAAARDPLEARRAAGFVRHCHGDLHLANIVHLDGRPVLFDCLEFSEELATIDVTYDLAFLLMDMIERGHPRAAWRCLQAYSEATLDDDGQALLPLFLAVRSAIRAKVEGFAVAVAQSAAAAATARDRAQGYLRLAGTALRPPAPRLVAIGGRSGTGKSSVAMALAPTFGAMPGAVVLRSDVIRKRLFGKAPDERLPDEAYDPEVSARVFTRLAERAAGLLRGGRSIVADGTFADPVHRAALEAAAARAGVPFTGLWLEAPERVLVERVAARRGDASDADVAVVLRQRAMADAPAGWRVVPADRPLAEVVGTATERLAEDLPGAER